MDLKLESLPSLEDVEPQRWNALAGGNPFLRHEFLVALERNGCVGPGTGWQPCPIVATAADGRLVGALPLYMKYDSRGEFVFDWSWADAYERAGGHYYPKLVAAIPYTPATGRRLLCDAAAPGAAGALLEAAIALRDELDASSLHVLFPEDSEHHLLSGAGFLARKSCQFHWHNDGYADFDDFLSRFSSAKRKKARRERRRIAESDVRFEHLHGDELDEADWDAVFELHARTFLIRGRRPYLNRSFFAEVARSMPENVVVILARHHRVPIAAAICFRGGDTLYGRYWGSVADFHSLHFETCYYQGIDYCIREGLAKFEPGTQGEHKISRGFTPSATWSWHLLGDPRFHAAVEEFLSRETTHVDAYMDYLGDHVPYRRERGETSTG